MELVVGLGMCAMVVVRVLAGEPIGEYSLPAVGAAVLAAGVVGVRGRWPVVGLGLAVVAGVVAMLAELRATPLDLIVGIAIVASAIVRKDVGWSPRSVLVLAGFAVAALVPVDLKEAAAVPLALAAYETAKAMERRVAVAVSICAAGILAVGATLVSADAWTGADTPVPMIAATVIGAATGDAVRSRREVERAWQERTKQGVIEERLRIARDVHDLVAHHIAVMNLQAGVAHHHLDNDQDQAKQALANVREAGRTVLNELGTLLSVMRELTPAPSLDDLDRLVASSGLDVDVTTTGKRQLTAVVELTAYRILQEALTNAHKHGTGQATIRLHYGQEHLELEVSNPTHTHPANTTGHGIQGMRERVAAMKGTLEAGEDSAGEFTVHATIPVQP